MEKTSPFEIQSATLMADGFRLRFTQSLAQIPAVGTLEIYEFHYNYWQLYGPKCIDSQRLQPGALPEQELIGTNLKGLVGKQERVRTAGKGQRSP